MSVISGGTGLMGCRGGVEGGGGGGEGVGVEDACSRGRGTGRESQHKSGIDMGGGKSYIIS